MLFLVYAVGGGLFLVCAVGSGGLRTEIGRNGLSLVYAMGVVVFWLVVMDLLL